MKVAISLVLLACALTGCAIVPAGPVGVYVEPAPMVVAPGAYYYGYGHYGYGRRYWRR